MSLHKSFKYSLVLPKPGNVSSFVAYKNLLLVSLSNGTLIYYKVEGKTDNYIFRLKEIKKFPNLTKNGITQMEVVKPKKLLIALYNTTVQLFNLKEMKPLEILCKKNALLFSYNGKQSLCIGLKSKLLIFKWIDKQFKLIMQIPLPSRPQNLVWLKAKFIVIGFAQYYSLLNLKSQVDQLLFTIKEKNTPIISTKISEQEILLQRYQTSIFKDIDGKASRSYAITWPEAPHQILYFYPYIIGFLSNEIQIRTLDTNQLIQKLKIKKLQSKFTLENHKNENFGYVLNNKGIWRFDLLPLLIQIATFSFANNFDKALQLCNLLTNIDENFKNEKAKQIKYEYAFHLFNQRQFSRALEFFTQINCDPKIVLSLYPFLINVKDCEPIKLPFFRYKKLTLEEQEDAIFALIEYLTQRRISDEIKKLKNYEQVLSIIDTTIIKAYIKTNKYLVLHFLKLPNYCDFEECEKIFLQNNLKEELILLYQSTGRHKKALEIIDLEYTRKGEITKLTQYLESLNEDHLELIYHYVKKIYIIDQDICLNIFINDLKTEENVIGKRKLPKLLIKKFIETNLPKILIPYLEHFIYKLNDQTKEFHNDLFTLYYQLFQTITHNIQLKSIIEKKIIKFLTFSRSYNCVKILNQLQENEILNAQIILYHRMYQYKNVIRIYIHKLINIGDAIKYCDRNYDLHNEKSKDIYLILIYELLLTFEENINSNNNKKKNNNKNNFNNIVNENYTYTNDENFKIIISILEKHHTKIDTLKILSLFHKNTNFSQISKYLLLVFKHLLRTKRRVVIQKNLHKSHNLNMKACLSTNATKSFLIDEYTRCEVCGKNIRHSVIGIYPNGRIVHQSCIIAKK
ncbi:cnh domain containing [Anaeramoeba flamelloides]|uniref:Cnh domain containing n=1 Tax=Anaeramoeba flamelloides TaxID=1746091 RepID=A0AAV7YRP8_9EUKA|nr:cnh domain containing [Anaeramoeba flamelloides]